MRSSILFLFTLIISSCSWNDQSIENKKLSINKYPQEWKLVKMTTGLSGTEKRGEKMSWQESYMFKSDGSFLKTRKRDGEVRSANGKYSLQEKNREKFFKLEYDNESPLIGNCSSENTEYLYFDEHGDYLMSNWWACDGPGLYYQEKR